MTDQDYAWLKFGSTGVVEVNVDGDGVNWVPLRRAKLGDVKTYGLMLEDGDAKTRVAEAQIRLDVGMNEEQQKWLAILNDPTNTPTAEALLNGPQLIELETMYVEAVKRWAYSDDNPYPKIWQAMLADMGGLDVSEDDMHPGMLGSQPISDVINHFQNAPLVRGLSQSQPASGQPNRAERRGSKNASK